jgi:hypothetical protein
LLDKPLDKWDVLCFKGKFGGSYVTVIS